MGADCAIGRCRRVDPAPSTVELRLKGGVDWIVPFIAGAAPPAFLGLVMKDPEEPRAELRAALEAIERFDERHEHVLREILGLLDSESHAAGCPVERTRMLIHDRAYRVWIRLTQAS